MDKFNLEHYTIFYTKEVPVLKNLFFKKLSYKIYCKYFVYIYLCLYIFMCIYICEINLFKFPRYNSLECNVKNNVNFKRKNCICI